MIFKEAKLEKVDFSDESFRITESLHSEPLLESLRAIGLLNPAILLERGPRFIIVCGFRRAHALKLLGSPQILARVLSEDHCEPEKLFHLALWDNLSHRQFDPLEKARALFKLKNHFNISEDILVRRHLPIMGLSAHASVLHSYLRINEAHSDLRKCLADGRLTIASMETIAQTPKEAQQRIAALMGKIRLSASLQRKFLDVLRDLAAIESTQMGMTLEDPEAQSIVDSPHLSPFQKGEKLYEFLYCRRNPRLTQATKQFYERKKSLGLPEAIKIAPDPFFENPGVRVEFQAPDVRRFREMVSALGRAAQMQTIEEIFQA